MIDDSTRERMRDMLKEIQTGMFASEWIKENMVERPTFRTIVRKEKEHPIEIVGLAVAA